MLQPPVDIKDFCVVQRVVEKWCFSVLVGTTFVSRTSLGRYFTVGSTSLHESIGSALFLYGYHALCQLYK